MASNLLKLHIQTIKTTNPSTQFLPLNRTPFLSLTQKQKIRSLSINSSLSSPTPPSSKEQAILQAKTSLATTLEKPLNNPKLAGKLKRPKQPRLRVEIPVVDDSPVSLSQLAFEVFRDLPIKRKGPPVHITIIWPSANLTKSAIKAFESNSSNNVQHIDISSVTSENNRILNSADVAVFLAPESSQLAVIKTVTESLFPKPVVVFNPTWGIDEESDFSETLRNFMASFEVVYSFTGLEVRGVLSKKKGVIFKCVKDGVLSGERWAVLVEEKGELKVVSKFKARPSIGEVENVLYNLMAVNSPITKSAKFFRELVSNVTGKK